MSRRSILFCFAHPDDESFSGAGTAMMCAAAGARTALVTATLGESGKRGDPPVCAPEELAACRERELRAAAAIIGFDELHLLGYRDRELAAAPPEEIRFALVSIVRRLRPQVVVTFDPNGFNVHPDHIAISRFTSDALAAAADRRWYPEAGQAHAAGRLLWTPPYPPWDAVRFDEIGTQPAADFVLDVSGWRDRRAEALRVHRTQHLSVERHFFSKGDIDRILSVEVWRQAWGSPLRQRPSHDIFEGL
jgi:LmbE family N-acetylglucosaminyl deacetylase